MSILETALPMTQIHTYAERTNGMLRALGVSPIPKYYALFFAVAAGQPQELVREVEKAVADKTEFTEALLDHWHSTYLAEAQTRVMQETTANAQEILSQMMQNIDSFSGDAGNVSADVVKQLKQLDAGASEAVVRNLAKSVVAGANSIQSSSKDVSQRLAHAQDEILHLRESLAKVSLEAERDFLTGCYNRKAFDQRLQEAIAEANEQLAELSLLMIDIDHFKKFNDKFGHLVGDEVLKIVAKVLMDSLKGSDCIARFGGEEFVVFLPRTPIGGGMVVAETVRKAVASRDFKRKDSGETLGVITISVGVASLQRDKDTVHTLVERADHALYVSKKAGRNRITGETVI